jgi:hypothetical protein
MYNADRVASRAAKYNNEMGGPEFSGSFDRLRAWGCN